MRLRLFVAALGVVALAALALGRGPAGQREATGAGPPAPPKRVEALASPSRSVDPAGIRDLFRFADSPLPVTPGVPARAAGQREDAPAPAGPRLVGLVSRAGRLVAALAADGEVVLAGPGETAAGVTVLAVDEEGVRIRRADGTEEQLVLP